LYIVSRILTFVRGGLLTYGPRVIKRRVWDKEYRDNKWHFADNTMGDCVYPHLEKHARNGSILDMGCGSGNTATELAESAYHSYVGVDISEAALAKAIKRTKESGRQDKNSFACSDFLAYQPAGQFDVVLFRESMYHVPLGKIKDVLDRYSAYLKEGGVIIVRLFAGSRETSKSKYRPNAMLAIMEAEFDVVERSQYPVAGLPTVIVLRSKRAVKGELTVESRDYERRNQVVSR
jgi:2-polyprenyl-3-methyl-5-hydroxy-6-metoxy-1,4-benzoquinol methylase